jgi:hypothetical protein
MVGSVVRASPRPEKRRLSAILPGRTEYRSRRGRSGRRHETPPCPRVSAPATERAPHDARTDTRPRVPDRSPDRRGGARRRHRSAAAAPRDRRDGRPTPLSPFHVKHDRLHRRSPDHRRCRAPCQSRPARKGVHPRPPRPPVPARWVLPPDPRRPLPAAARNPAHLRPGYPSPAQQQPTLRDSSRRARTRAASPPWRALRAGPFRQGRLPRGPSHRTENWRGASLRRFAGRSHDPPARRWASHLESCAKRPEIRQLAGATRRAAVSATSASRCPPPCRPP